MNGNQRPRERVLILGAAGRDYHNFNLMYRNNPIYEVVGFTHSQIPFIESHEYPPVISGDLYPKGIPIDKEEQLEKIIKDKGVAICIMSYSDLPHTEVMNLAARVHSAGADFQMLSHWKTMVESKKPLIAVTAARTGCGKSQVCRYVIDVAREMGKQVVLVRHPMPYGNLAKQVVQRFATLEDLDRHQTTIEEREEYEQHIRNGIIVYAGVDYEKILRQAEEEADIVLWDGGNNDTPFYRPGTSAREENVGDTWCSYKTSHRSSIIWSLLFLLLTLTCTVKATIAQLPEWLVALGPGALLAPSTCHEPLAFEISYCTIRMCDIAVHWGHNAPLGVLLYDFCRKLWARFWRAQLMLPGDGNPGARRLMVCGFSR